MAMIAGAVVVLAAAIIYGCGLQSNRYHSAEQIAFFLGLFGVLLIIGGAIGQLPREGGRGKQPGDS